MIDVLIADDHTYSFLLNILFYVIVNSLLITYLTYIWRNTRKTILLRYYIVMHIIALFFLFGGFIYKVFPLNQKNFAASIIIMLRTCFDISFLCFAYYFDRREHINYKVFIILIVYLFFSLYITMVFPDVNPLYINVNNIPVLLMFLIGFLLKLISAVLIGRNIMDNWYYVVTLAFTIFIIQFLIMSRIIYSPVDTYPFLFAILFTILFFGTYRFGLLNTLSLGLVKGLEMVNEAIVIFDDDSNLIYKNRTSRKYSEEILEYIIDNCREHIKGEFARQQGEKQVSPEELVLTLSIRPIFSIMGHITGYVCVIHDDTDITEAINKLNIRNDELEEINKSILDLAKDARRLAILRERNMLANDIHDVLGHSLNYVLQVLESNRIIMQEDPERALKRLLQAAADIDKGLGEIRTTSQQDKTEFYHNYTAFLTKLEKMAEQLKEVNVNLEILTDVDISIKDEKICKTLYRICQEAITNSIKHGHADQVVVNLRDCEEKLLLNIIDNGKGCTTFEKGNGLCGMTKRIEEIGGSISFNNFEDRNGFMINANIPII